MLSDFLEKDQEKLKFHLTSKNYHGLMNLKKKGKFGQNDERWNSWAKQILKRGFDDTELWNLKITALKWFLPRLKAFRDIDKISYPCNLPSKDGPEQWNEILDQMIWWCDEIITEKEFRALEPLPEENFQKKYKEYDKKIDKCLDLFKKYFLDLWD